MPETRRVRLSTTEAHDLAVETVPEFELGAIRAARLTAPRPADVAEPIVFDTEPGARRFVRARVALVAVAVLVWVLIGSPTGGGSAGSRPAAVTLTPAQQRTMAARRARAAAIAQAKRDRGTAAELEDTIPAVTPAP